MRSGWTRIHCPQEEAKISVKPRRGASDKARNPPQKHPIERTGGRSRVYSARLPAQKPKQREKPQHIGHHDMPAMAQPGSDRSGLGKLV